MNVLVNDVAADSSGALSVLMDFYREVINSNEDTLQWYFVVSIPQLLEYKNVHVSRYPWVKKSWLHRLFFEYFVIPRIIRRNNIKCLVSLQNTSTVFKRVLTILYIHQSLPFSSYRFKFYKNPKLWIYQNIIGKLIKKSIKKANIVITQTETMREECAKYSLPNSEKFRVISPNLSIEPKDHFKPSKENLRVFFYPATPLNYKNHALIIEAFSKLSDSDIQDYQVIFTFERDDTRLTKRLYKKAEKLKVPIELVGHLSRERVFDYYCKSILLFPSFIESYPL
ncbi:MAG TPA: glycosyl transferase family 1, partial [Thermotogota bacterium]|nr:glycosyl transferase family 1 [Thermotogota bacterium]